MELFQLVFFVRYRHFIEISKKLGEKQKNLIYIPPSKGKKKFDLSSFFHFNRKHQQLTTKLDSNQKTMHQELDHILKKCQKTPNLKLKQIIPKNLNTFNESKTIKQLNDNFFSFDPTINWKDIELPFQGTREQCQQESQNEYDQLMEYFTRQKLKSIIKRTDKKKLSQNPIIYELLKRIDGEK